jgi:rhamnogalacturonan endolyase
VSNNWGAGFTGAIRITNNGTNAINGWNVSWTYAGNTRLSGTWNATVTGSNPYAATNLSWNSSIQPGQSVEFGFQGTHSGTAEIPAITGSACN